LGFGGEKEVSKKPKRSLIVISFTRSCPMKDAGVREDVQTYDQVQRGRWRSLLGNGTSCRTEEVRGRERGAKQKLAYAEERSMDQSKISVPYFPH